MSYMPKNNKLHLLGILDSIQKVMKYSKQLLKKLEA